MDPAQIEFETKSKPGRLLCVNFENDLFRGLGLHVDFEIRRSMVGVLFCDVEAVIVNYASTALSRAANDLNDHDRMHALDSPKLAIGFKLKRPVVLDLATGDYRRISFRTKFDSAELGGRRIFLENDFPFHGIVLRSLVATANNGRQASYYQTT